MKAKSIRLDAMDSDELSELKNILLKKQPDELSELSKLMRVDKKTHIKENDIVVDDNNNNNTDIVVDTVEQINIPEKTIIETIVDKHTIIEKTTEQPIPYNYKDHKDHIKLMRIVRRLSNMRNIIINVYSDCQFYNEVLEFTKTHFKIELFDSKIDDGVVEFRQNFVEIAGNKFNINHNSFKNEK